MKRKTTIKLPKPFVTIAHQFGIPARKLARRLLENFAKQKIASITLR